MRITSRPPDSSVEMMRREPDAHAMTTHTSKPPRASPFHRELKSTCAFTSQAQVLCVGTSVVYRVLIDVAVASSCDRRTLLNQMRRSRSHRWSIAMTHAKLHHVCAQIQQLVSSLYFAVYHQNHDNHDSQVLHRLYRPLADALVRYDDLCQGFSISASGETLMVTQYLLVAFLQDCWRAFEAVLPLVCNSSTRPADLDVEVRKVYDVMQDLFVAPPEVIEASCMYATALANIEEVADHEASTRDCSICLDPTATTDSATVRLPCHHVFHDQCIIQWMQQSLTCPDCRKFLGH